MDESLALRDRIRHGTDRNMVSFRLPRSRGNDDVLLPLAVLVASPSELLCLYFLAAFAATDTALGARSCFAAIISWQTKQHARLVVPRSLHGKGPI